MNEIELQIAAFLDRSLDGPVDLPEEVVEEFGEACKDALRKQFTEPRNEGFTLRMSNVGRPLCQLQMDKAGAEKERSSPFFKLQMLIGDMHEAAIIAVMRAAGVKVKEVQKKVKLTLKDGTALSGTLDVVIETSEGEGVYDIKSASPWSFKNKFKGGYAALEANDAFGYVGQGHGYSNAVGLPFRGWIASDKSSGEITVCDCPIDTDAEPVIDEINETAKAIAEDRPFKRCFEDQPETFRKKETGNRVLGMPCKFCDFKFSCWPGLVERPSIPSKAKDPKTEYYTHIENEEV